MKSKKINYHNINQTNKGNIMKLNEISGWRAKWLLLAIFWTLAVILYKNDATNGLLLSSMNFELWYPTIKAFTLPAVAIYFCIDIFRYAFRVNRNQLT